MKSSKNPDVMAHGQSIDASPGVPPSQQSLTSSDSFRLRAQRSEQGRTVLMLLLLLSLLILGICAAGPAES